MQILRQSTETLERAKCPLQPAVMCSVSGPPAEPASLGANPDGSVLIVGAKRLEFFRPTSLDPRAWKA